MRAPGATEDALFWTRLDDAAKKLITASASYCEYPADTTLTSMGGQANPVWIVKSGLVTVSGNSARGNRRILTILGAGDIVGELACLSGWPRSATVQAKTAVALWEVACGRFLQIATEHPAVAKVLLRVLARRLIDTSRQLYDFNGSTSRQRVVSTLLALSTRFGASMQLCALKFTQEEIAHLAAASRPAVARTLADLRNQGLVSTSRGTITILEPQRLKLLAT